MTEDEWLEILARISPDGPADLNTVGSVPGRAAVQPDTVPDIGGFDLSPPPSSRLWQRHDDRQSGLGVRVTSPIADCAAAAIRLASVALERGLMPVILTTLPDSGFERFGFRVERLPEGTADQRRAYEAELTRFWSLAIIIDAADIALIG